MRYNSWELTKSEGPNHLMVTEKEEKPLIDRWTNDVRLNKTFRYNLKQYFTSLVKQLNAVLRTRIRLDPKLFTNKDHQVSWKKNSVMKTPFLT